MKKFICLLLFSVFINILYAETWVLDKKLSKITFVSAKNTNILEINNFHKLSGYVKSTGEARFSIDANSIDTKIKIRDDRIKQELLESNIFPQIYFKTKLDPELLQKISQNNKYKGNLTIEGDLRIKNFKSQIIKAKVKITKTNKNLVKIATIEPIKIDLRRFHLQPGVEKLRLLAHLENISMIVPVTFVLYFKS